MLLFFIWKIVNSGFLMFYTEEKTRLRHAMHEVNLQEVRFRFDFGGTQVIINE